MTAPPNHSFIDLEIRIFQRGEAGYPVEVTLGGEQELARGALAADILPWTSSGDIVADGQRLFDALLADSALRSAWNQARGQAPQRRIRLRIDPEAAELHTLPWELLQEEATLLSANAATPFSRYLPASRPWGGAVQERPIRVLAVLSNPNDLEELYNLARLDLDQERSILEKAFFTLDQDEIQLDLLEPPATLERLEEALHKGYHILHYVGHGVFNKRKDQAALYLQDAEGDAQVVSDQDLIGMLARQRARPRLIFLAACQTATRSTADAFAGLAPRLVAAGAPAVVAMQDFVAVKTAHKLSLAFYRRLAEHGMVDCAMNEARSTLLTAGRPDAAVPVLLMRLKSGQLWGSEAEPAEASEEPRFPPPPEPTPLPQDKEFVGREAELAYYADKLAASHLAVISGMAGVGKTALACMLAARVAEPEKVFWHAFHRGETIEEMVWKLAGFLYWRGQADMWHMLQSASGAQVLGVRELLDYIAQALHGRDYVLCLDDLQFLSETDANLLGRFIRRMVSSTISFIVTSQTTPEFMFTADQFEPLSGLSQEDTIKLLTQHGFTVDQTSLPAAYETHMLSRMQDRALLPAEIAVNLHARTGGNAQLLTLAIDGLKRTPTMTRFIIQMFLDNDIERFLIKDIDSSLTDDERAVMSAAAVLLGYAGTREAIEAVLEGQNVRRTLSDLVQRHLLTVREGKTGREYSMNAIVRHFYYDALSKPDRQAMHRRVGEHYETIEPDMLKAARHMELAGEIEQAARLATTDVWASVNRGQAQTLRLLLESFTAEQVDLLQWVKIELALGQVYAFLGDMQPARASYQSALSNLIALPGSRETQSKVSLDKIWGKLAEKTRKHDLAAVWDKLEHKDRASDSPDIKELRIRIYQGMGELLQYEAPQEALDWLRRGLEELAGTNKLGEATLHIKMGSVQARIGNYALALESIYTGLALLPQESGSMQAQVAATLGMIYREMGDIQQSLAWLRQALDMGRRLSNNMSVMVALTNLGATKFIAGDWQGAAADIEQSLQLARQLGNVGVQAKVAQSRGWMCARQGDYRDASARLASSLEMAHTHQLSGVLPYVLNSLAELQILNGNAEVAGASLREAEQLASDMGIKSSLVETHRLSAQRYLALAQPQPAQQPAQTSLDLARELQMKREGGISWRVLGQALLADKQHRQALEAFEQSLTLLADIDPYETAHTHMQWGAALVASGESEQGARLLRQAQAAFEMLGAQRDLETVRKILGGDP